MGHNPVAVASSLDLSSPAAGKIQTKMKEVKAAIHLMAFGY